MHSCKNQEHIMTTIVTENCNGCRYTDCVTVCPVACFHADDKMLYIDNEVCIQCSACIPTCPVHAIYAAEALLKSTHAVNVDLIERLPAPFGLVRYGVAPDHPKLKEAILTYQVIARLPRFALLGNVTVGRDVTVDELRAHYHAVVFTCGAEADRRLGVPGEDLPGSHTATEFVAWYNGHPEYRDRHFDLSAEVVAVVGQGNVAADVCRILAKSVDELRSTDIAEHALDALAASRVREIHVIGRDRKSVV